MAIVMWDGGRTKTLSIASAAQETDILDVGIRGDRQGFDGYLTPSTIAITAPPTLTGVVTIEVCHTSDGTYVTLQSVGVDVNITATKGMVISPGPFRFLKIVSSAPEGGIRNFILQGQYQ